MGIKNRQINVNQSTLSQYKVVEFLYIGDSLFYTLENGSRHQYKTLTLSAYRKLREFLVVGMEADKANELLKNARLEGAQCLFKENLEVIGYDEETYTLEVLFCGDRLEHFIRPDIYQMFLEEAEFQESGLLSAYKRVVLYFHHGSR